LRNATIVVLFFSYALVLLGSHNQDAFAEPENTEVTLDVFQNGFSELTINDPDGIAQIVRVNFDTTSHGCSTNVSPFGVLVPRIIIVSDCQDPRDVTEWLITDSFAACLTDSCHPDNGGGPMPPMEILLEEDFDSFPFNGWSQSVCIRIVSVS